MKADAPFARVVDTQNVDESNSIKKCPTCKIDMNKFFVNITNGVEELFWSCSQCGQIWKIYKDNPL